MGNLTLLHIGCGNDYKEGFINSDMVTGFGRKRYKLDLEMDISKPWPYENESVDGIVAMHVFPHLTWHQLIPAFRESYRVLKVGGVLRFGCVMIEMTDRPLEYLQDFNNINLFSYDLLKRVLVGRIGYKEFTEKRFRRSVMPELASVDNRYGKTKYYEGIK